MGWIANIRNVFISGFASIRSSHDIVGLGKKYLIKQEQTEVPFEQGYAKQSDVYAIVNKIVGPAITVPWILKKRTGDKEELITKGEVYDIIRNPNPQQALMQYVEEGMTQRLLGGNNYLTSLVPEGFTTPSQTMLLHPQFVHIETMIDFMTIVPKFYKYLLFSKTFIIDTDEVTHLKYCNPTEYGISNLTGLSPLVAGYLTLTGLTNNQTAQASILEHQGAAGIISNEETDNAMMPDERDEAQERLDKGVAGATLFGKIYLSAAKVRYQKLGLDPTALKILESKLMMTRDLCNIWDVRSVLFNDTQASTRNNVEEAIKALWVGPVKSNLEAFKEAFETEVLTPFNDHEFPTGKSEYFIELDWSVIPVLQADELRKAQKEKTNSDGINLILSSNSTTEGKVLRLQSQYGYTEEDAKIIADPAPLPPANTD
jgi:HK97 family phage portal protein